MEPVRSNILSKTCTDPIGSNCIIYSGPPIQGQCGVLTMTQVVATLSSQISEAASCCSGTFPDGHQSCYKDTWTDFSSSIPTAGSVSGFSWAISNMGIGFFNSTSYYKPQYKWTKQGDLKFRGAFNVHILATQRLDTGAILLYTIPPSCFPTGWTATQTIIIDGFVDTANSNVVDKVGNAYVTLEYPTGNFYLNLLFADLSLGAFDVSVDISTTFNTA